MKNNFTTGRRWDCIVLSFVAMLTCAVNSTSAQELSRSQTEFFETKIRPVLVANCYQCHSAESAKSKGGLKVDSKQSLLTGGDSGSAIVPRSTEKSLLYQSLTYDGDFQMPPKGKLPDSVIADFRKWIEMGAPDPRETKIAAAVQTEIDIEEGRSFWAYQQPAKQQPPQSANNAWARTPIDQFVIAGLDSRNLTPAADADAQTLVRRLHFTLIGLPPSPEATTKWTTRIQQSSEAQKQQIVSELVDELLASERFGERWGRHWLDVARFAESTGGDQNNIYQHAWRYRDYVIDSFNADKPYDQFIREQIAGDLLPIANDREWADNVVATGFLSIGTKLVGEEDQQKFVADLVDEQIDTTTRAFLATTVACARCHDHKFDPIPQSDYYAMAGIFRATETHYGLLKAQARQATTLLDLSGLGLESGTPSLSKKEYAELVKARDDAKQTVEDAMRKIRAGENVFRGTLRRIRSQRDEAEAALQSFSAAGEAKVFAMGTQDRDFILPTRLLVRGEIDKPAQEVPRGVLQVLEEPGKHAFSRNTQGSGRIELAEWIASEQNPLTARVMANRVWNWMVGRGLVRTVDDFGASGTTPSHPELLDYLALRLVENNWSVKQLVREIALSRTWQLSSRFNPSNFAVDPDNEFLWRMNSRRLEAEAVRDAMLAVSGELDLKRPVGTYLREVGEGNVGQNVFEPVVRAIDAPTRSVYLPRVRDVLPEMLELFDAPDASFVTGSRDATSSPLQSLFLLNNDFVQQRAAALANRVEQVPVGEQVEALYHILYGRSPTENELRLGQEFLIDRMFVSQSTRRSGTSPTTNVLAVYCQALLCTTEFQTMD